MIKFLLKFTLPLFFSFSASAGLITTDLVNDYEKNDLTFITYGGYDWTWASSVSTTNFSATDPTTGKWVDNVFDDPTTRAGWMSIPAAQLLDIEVKRLFSSLELDLFKRNGKLIQSAAYWNSHFVHVDVDDFNKRVGIKGADGYVFEENDTFYVRKSVAVPEPSTLFVFAIGLLALTLRKRLTH